MIWSKQRVRVSDPLNDSIELSSSLIITSFGDALSHVTESIWTANVSALHSLLIQLTYFMLDPKPFQHTHKGHCQIDPRMGPCHFNHVQQEGHCRPFLFKVYAHGNERFMVRRSPGISREAEFPRVLLQHHSNADSRLREHKFDVSGDSRR